MQAASVSRSMDLSSPSFLMFWTAGLILIARFIVVVRHVEDGGGGGGA